MAMALGIIKQTIIFSILDIALILKCIILMNVPLFSLACTNLPMNEKLVNTGY
jgi:hypothetical protein